jgi:hypothetical protein
MWRHFYENRRYMARTQAARRIASAARRPACPTGSIDTSSNPFGLAAPFAVKPALAERSAFSIAIRRQVGTELEHRP